MDASTAKADPATAPWILRSRTAGSIHVAIAAADSVLLTSALIAVAALLVMRQSPPFVPPLLPAFLSGFGWVSFCQLWTIEIALQRRRRVADSGSIKPLLQPFFAGLRPGVWAAIGVLWAGGWLLGMVQMLALSAGTPDARPGCSTGVNDHGHFACLSPAEFQGVVVAQPLMILGISSMFVALHAAVAASAALEMGRGGRLIRALGRR